MQPHRVLVVGSAVGLLGFAVGWLAGSGTEAEYCLGIPCTFSSDGNSVTGRCGSLLPGDPSCYCIISPSETDRPPSNAIVRYYQLQAGCKK